MTRLISKILNTIRNEETGTIISKNKICLISFNDEISFPSFFSHRFKYKCHIYASGKSKLTNQLESQKYDKYPVLSRK
jgi:hypothetical protein